PAELLQIFVLDCFGYRHSLQINLRLLDLLFDLPYSLPPSDMGIRYSLRLYPTPHFYYKLYFPSMLILLLLIFVGNENVHQTQMIEQTPHLLSVYYSNLRYLVKNYAPYIYLLASRKNNLLSKITYH